MTETPSMNASEKLMGILSNAGSYVATISASLIVLNFVYISGYFSNIDLIYVTKLSIGDLFMTSARWIWIMPILAFSAVFWHVEGKFRPEAQVKKMNSADPLTRLNLWVIKWADKFAVRAPDNGMILLSLIFAIGWLFPVGAKLSCFILFVFGGPLITGMKVSRVVAGLLAIIVAVAMIFLFGRGDGYNAIYSDNFVVLSSDQECRVFYISSQTVLCITSSGVNIGDSGTFTVQTLKGDST